MLLISNCGTSLLSNDASEVDRNWLMEHANEPDVDGGRLGSIMEASRRKLLEADAAKQRLMSAEIKRIYAAIERYRPEEVFHQLSTLIRPRVRQEQRWCGRCSIRILLLEALLDCAPMTSIHFAGPYQNL